MHGNEGNRLENRCDAMEPGVVHAADNETGIIIFLQTLVPDAVLYLKT